MTNRHPITPPLELVQQWTSLACEEEGGESWNSIATQAAQWGADQELEACCALMDDWGLDETDLRAARRPKPPSLKEQALARCNDYIDPDGIIRRALEALPND
jgi:hypothetical protein